MKKSQLEIALRRAGEIARDSHFIVFGSQCILGVIATPPKGCLISQELDLYPRTHPQAVGLLVKGMGLRSDFSKRHGFFVDCVTPDLAAMPEGWTDRLVPFHTKRTGGVTGWCLELHDLAASKLAATRDKDLKYVDILLNRGLIKLSVLKDRISTLPITPSHRNDLIDYLQKKALKPTPRFKLPRKRKRAK